MFQTEQFFVIAPKGTCSQFVPKKMPLFVFYCAIIQKIVGVASCSRMANPTVLSLSPTTPSSHNSPMPHPAEESGDDDDFPLDNKPKRWGGDDNVFLGTLVAEKKINITNTTPKYIDTIRRKYPIFHRLDKKNFRRNYRNLAASHDLQKYFGGARRRGGGGGGDKDEVQRDSKDDAVDAWGRRRHRLRRYSDGGGGGSDACLVWRLSGIFEDGSPLSCKKILYS